MKTTLVWKRIDTYLQIAAIIIPCIFAIVDQNFFELFITYFTLGSVQVISCIMNATFLDSFLKDDGRRSYQRMLIVVACIGVVSAVTPLVMIYLFILLFVSPFMAIWYLNMSYNELQTVRAQVERKQFV